MRDKLTEWINQLGDPHHPIRHRAYRELEKKATVDALISGLQHENWRIRKSCAALMDHIADERCAKPLTHVLEKDPIADVRRLALHSLVCDRCKTVPLDVDTVGVVSKTALMDTSIRVRRKATTTLGLLPTSDRRKKIVLKRLLEDPDPEIRRRANWCLHRPKNKKPNQLDYSPNFQSP